LLTPDDIRKPPKGMDDAVLDTPAGLHGKALGEVLALADKVIVPLQASVFDIHAAHDFFQDLLQRKRVAKLDVGVVGMRLRETTMAAEQLRQYLGQIPFEVIGALRDTQHYVQLCAHGLSLWDVAPSRVERDLAQWESLQRFLAPRVA
jgi:chromosome partitioning protein